MALPVAFALPVARAVQVMVVEMSPFRLAQVRRLAVLCRSLLAQEAAPVATSELLQEVVAARVANSSFRVGLPRQVVAAAFLCSRPMECPRVPCLSAVARHRRPTLVQCGFHLAMPLEAPVLSQSL